MPDSTGFGDYTESGQVIPVSFRGEKGGYVHAMYLDCDPPIAGGRELWGFPKKLASPVLKVEKDTLCGVLRFGPVPIAAATMGYKHRAIDDDKVRESLEAPDFLLKIIPHVDGTPRICELVRYQCGDVTVHGAWRVRRRWSCSITRSRRSLRCRCWKCFPPSTSCRTSP